MISSSYTAITPNHGLKSRSRPPTRRALVAASRSGLGRYAQDAI